MEMRPEDIAFAFRSAIEKSGIPKEMIVGAKCPNQIVGIIAVEKYKVTFVENFLSKDKRQSKDYKTFLSDALHSQYKGEIIRKSIVLILESPYKDEFNEKNEPIGPACGKTGMNISKYLLSNIMKYRLMSDEGSNGCFARSSNEISEGLYTLCLVNAVPFRCKYDVARAGGGGKRDTKEFILDECYSNEKSIFGQKLPVELQKFHPTIIVNAMTEGSYKGVVSEIIKKHFPNKILLESYHPSSGFFLLGFHKL